MARLSAREKLSRLGSVFGTVMMRAARTIIGIPVAVVAGIVGMLVFAAGAVIAPVDERRGSDVRMRGLNTMGWGADWIPFDVEVEWNDE